VTVYRDLALELSPFWGKGEFAANLIGTIAGILPDTVAEGASQAIRSVWLTLSNQPDDEHDQIGTERNMPRYRGESADTYRARLLKAWVAWGSAGTPAGIIAQYNAFGLSNVSLQPINPLSATEWSWFRVIISEPHPYIADPTPPTWGGQAWGTFNWGIGLEPDDTATLIDIAKRWKSGHERVKQIVILPTGVSVWGFFNWGGANWGGSPPPIVIEVP
jgi:hypothetical protein